MNPAKMGHMNSGGDRASIECHRNWWWYMKFFVPWAARSLASVGGERGLTPQAIARFLEDVGREKES